MQFIDLKTQYQHVQAAVRQGLDDVLASGAYVMGPAVGAFEQSLSDFIGGGHVIAVSSGTDALLLALLALDIGPGDEVITPAFSFIAAAEMVALLGAIPVFVEVDPETYLLDEAHLETLITDKTKAIIPVDLYGQSVRMERIEAVAQSRGIPVISDAAQSLGARRQGVPVGRLGAITATSFYPSKPLGCYGDGGACFTDDDALAERLRSHLNHGQAGRYQHTLLGINGRLDAFQAAVLSAKLDVFPGEIKARAQVASWYAAALQAAGVCAPPVVLPENTHVYAQYTVQVEARAAVQEAMQAAGIPTAVHYPKPIHQQPVMQTYYARHGLTLPSLPVSERLAERVLSLPMHPYLSHAEVKTVVSALQAACATAVD